MKKRSILGTGVRAGLVRTLSARRASRVVAVAGEPLGFDGFGRLVGGLAPMLVLALLAPRSLAGPEGAEVANGQVAINRQGDTTVIHASHNAVINYKSFDIKSHETVQFVQPDALARVLNRINSAAPTQIDGKLLANGQVFIVNPAGVMFGKNAVINAAGIFAAAGNITDENFVKGIYRFTDVKGAVVNEGVLHATGDVGLIGKTVTNAGHIVADRGAVMMASGDSVLIGEPGSNVYVKVEAPKDGEAGRRPGNSAYGAGDMFSLAIMNSGTVKSKKVHAEADRGVVSMGGAVDASSTKPGQTGGTVKVLGEYVAVSGTIDASGPAGGGEILIGGNFQGKGAERNATRTTITTSADVIADATQAGSGGRVIVWSDDQTNFQGHISARGSRGQGGFVEVSGKQNLRFRGTADLTGGNGINGTLLLDPATITITGGSGDGAADGTNTFAGDPGATVGTVLFADTGPTTVFESEIEGLVALATANIILQATDSIGTSGTFGGGALALGATNLTLQVENSTNPGSINLSGVTITSTTGIINIQGSTSTTNACDITLGPITTGAGSITAATGNGTLTANNAITTSGGAISLSSTGLLTTTGNLSTSGAGNITLNSSAAAININGSVIASGTGSISIDATGLTTVSAGPISANGGQTRFGNTGTGGLALTGDVNGSTNVLFNRATTISGDSVIFSDSGTITVASTLGTGSGTTSLAADEIDFTGGIGSVTGTGTLELFGASDSTSIGIGTGSTGTLDISATDQNALGANYTQINIGSETGTATTQIGSTAFNSPIHIRQGGVGGSVIIVATGSLFTTGDTVQVTAGTGDSGLFQIVDGGTISTTSAPIIITADSIDLGTTPAAITTTGAVTLQPASDARPIVLGAAGAAGDFALTTTEADDVLSGESSLTIGRSTGTHAYTVSAIDFGSGTTLRTSGTITVNGNVTDVVNYGGTVSAGAAVELAADAVTLNNLNVNANTVTVTADEIDIAGNVTGTGGLVLQPASNGVSIGIAGGSGTLDLSTGDLDNIASTLTSGLTIGRSNGAGVVTANTFTFAPATVIRNTSGGSITVAGALSAPALTISGVKTINANLTSTAGALNLGTGASTAGASVELNAGTGTLTVGAINLGTNTVTFTGDEVDFTGGAGTVTGTGSMVVQPSADGVSIGLAGGTGTLDLSTADLNAVGAAVTVLTVGRSTGTHTISSNSFDFATDFSARGSVFNLGGNIGTDRDPITITAPTLTVTAASARLDTTNNGAGGAEAGAAINVTGAVDGQTADTNTFIVRSGRIGGLTVGGAIGSVTRLSSLELSGGLLTYGNVRVNGNATFIGRNNILSAGVHTIGGQATFTTRLTSGANIAVTNVANQFGSVGGQTLQSEVDGTSIANAGFVNIVEDGDMSLLASRSASGLTVTALNGGNITVTQALEADGGFTSSGANFTLDSGATLTSLVGNISLTHTGTVTLNDAVTAINDPGQTVTIGGAAINVNSTIDADANVTLTGTGAGSIASAVTSNSGAVSITADGLTVTSAGSVSAATGATLSSAGNLQIGGDITTTGGAGLLRSGTDGTGNLSFSAAGVDLRADTLTLRAGDGAAGAGTAATVDAITNAPAFRAGAGGATSPTTFTHRQDGTITDSLVANAAQFGGGVAGVNYTLQSDDGNVNFPTLSKVQGANLTISNPNGLSIIAANITTSNTPLTFSNGVRIDASGVEVNTGTATLSFGSTLNLQGNNLTLTGDEIDFAGAVSGTGGLTLQPSANGVSIGLGGGTGTLELSDAELALLPSTLQLLNIGRSGGTHAVVIDSISLSIPTIVRGASTEVLVNATSGEPGIRGTGNGSFDLQTPTITLNDDIFTAGGPILLSGAVTLTPDTGNTVTLRTTESSATGADITLGGTVNSDGTFRDLVATAGDGSVIITGAVGGTANLASITASGASLTLPAVTTRGNQTYTGDATLGGNLTSNTAGAIAVSGQTLLSGPVTVATAGLANTDDITFTGGITGAQALTLNAGSGASAGDVRVTAAISGPTSLTSTGRTNDFAAVSTAGGQTYTGDSTFRGGLTATAAGAILVTGNTTLTPANMTISTAGGAATDDATFTGTITGASTNLIVSTGAGDSALQGTATLSSLTVASGATTTLAGVTTTGGQTYNATTTNINGNLSDTGTGSIGVANAAVVSGPTIAVQTAGSNATVSFQGALNAAAADTTDLTVSTSATNGVVTFGSTGGVGQATALRSMTVSGRSLNLTAVRTNRNQSYTGSTTIGIGGDLIALTNGSVTVTGDASVSGGNRVINTDGTAGDGAITFTGPIDAVVSGLTNLTLNAGTAAISLQGDAGTSSGSELASLTATGSTIGVRGVTTTGAQTYTGATTLNGALTSQTAGAVNITGDVTLAGIASIATNGGADSDDVGISGAVNGAQSLTINAGTSGDVSIGGAVGGATRPATLTVSGDQITLGSSVGTAGAQQYTGALTTLNGNLDATSGSISVIGDTALNADASVTTGGGNASFGGNVSGATRNLVVNAGTGDVDLSGLVHTIPSLNNVTASGRDIRVGQTSTNGAQTYTATREVVTTGELRAAGANNISLTGPTAVRLGGNATTGGAGLIAVTGPATLNTGPITVQSVNGGVNFSSSINSESGEGNALTLSAGTGPVTVGGDAGTGTGGALGSFSATGSAITTRGVTTTGSQTFAGPATVSGNLTSGGAQIQLTNTLTLGSDVTVTSNGGPIIYGDTINAATAGQQSLTSNSGTAATTVTRSVGGVNALRSVTIRGGALQLGSNAGGGTFAVNADDAVTVGGPATLTETTTTIATGGNSGDSISFESTIDGGSDLTLNAGVASVGFGAAGQTTPLTRLVATGGSIAAGGSVRTVGEQDFNGATTVSSANTVFQTGGGAGANVSIDGALDGDSAVVINAGTGGNVSLISVGQTTSLRSINANGALISLGGSVRTVGSQRFAAPVTLGGPTLVLQTDGVAGTGTIDFTGTVNGASDVTLNAGAANVTLAGAAGGATKLNSLTATGGVISLQAVNTVGAQAFTGATTVNSNLTSDSGAVGITGNATLATATSHTISGNGITISGSVSGPSALTLAGGAGNVAVGGAAGSSTAPLTSLNASGANVAVTSVNTSGVQSYTGNTAAFGDLVSTGAGSAGNISVTGDLQLNGASGTTPRRVNTPGAINVSGATALRGSSAHEFSGAGGVSLGGAVTTDVAGGTALTLNAGAAGVNVGGAAGTETNPLLSLTATGGTAAVGGVTTLGNQTYTAGTSTVNGDLRSTGTNGAIAFNGTSSTTVNNVSINAPASTTRVIRAAGPVTVTGTTALGGNNATHEISGSNIVLGGNVTGSGNPNLTLSAGNASAGASSGAPIRVASLGTSDATRLGTVTVSTGGADLSTAPSASVVISDAFRANGLIDPNGVQGTEAFAIAARRFEMRQGEKITAFGNLTIDATEFATLGDINTLGSLTVNSPQIRIATRDRAGFDVIRGNAVIRVPASDDLGVDFIASQNINFSVAPSTRADGVTALQPSEVSFGANSVGNIIVAGSSSFRQLQFQAPGLSRQSFQLGSDLLGLDFRADGQTTTNVATAIAGATPREAESGAVTQSVGISGALKDQLVQVGIYVKDLDLEQQVDFLAGRAIYVDVPSSPTPRQDEFRVTPNRLAVDRVQDMLAAYEAVVGPRAEGVDAAQAMADQEARIESAKATISAAWQEYVTSTGQPAEELKGELFREWLSATPSQSAALELLNKLREFFNKLDDLGLSPAEVGVPKSVMVNKILDTDQMLPEQLESAITGQPS